MSIYSDLKKNAFGKMCRSCINDEYNVILHRPECITKRGQKICEKCGEEKHIINDVVFHTKLRLMLNRKTYEEKHSK